MSLAVGFDLPTDPSDLERLDLELEKAACAKSYRYFIEAAWPIIRPGVRFIPGWHIDAVCDHMQAVAKFEIKELVISVPPGTSKSSCVSVGFMPWVWGPFGKPGRRSLNAAYAIDLAIRDSVEARRLIESDWYRQRWPITFAGDVNLKSRFDSDAGGTRIAISVGGGTGEHVHHITIDDAHRTDPRHRDNAATTQGVLDWWDKSISTRGVHPSETARVVSGQRLPLSPIDLPGHCIAQGYELLSLPMRYEPSRLVRSGQAMNAGGDAAEAPPRIASASDIQTPTSIGFEDPRTTEGELLWPAYMDEKYVVGLERTLGAFEAAGQLQQRPAPREGGIIKREWLTKFWTVLPDRIDTWLSSWDLTFKKGHETDFVAGQVWARAGGSFYLIDQVHDRMGFTATLAAIRAQCAKHPKISKKIVEDAANGPAVVDTLMHEIPGLIARPAEGDKDARLSAVSPYFEAGNVWLPDPSIAPWVNDYIEELCAVAPVHDDRRDATAQALRELSSASGRLQIYAN